MQHFANKVEFDGFKFDSEKEKHFYDRFIKPSGKRVDVHPSYPVQDIFRLGGYKVRGINYAPDFVVYDERGEIAHVYDVKTSVDSAGVDSAALLRFKLFERRYGKPVEVVVPRANDFKMTMFGFTTPHHILDKHAKRDRQGRLKQTKNGNYVYRYYNVYNDINYRIEDLVGR
ncbi:DUF1064 domain-containing protein [Limosilactobacillus ingluviei]|uniref:DUF1064 domain-containing protein n=1 Tax=Limosilactobacillus ingluviei TaxID=148604 RepID=UPI0023F063BF|nr:DUF1064 domain-containing protein [Limosilactobacillus ingluviei]